MRGEIDMTFPILFYENVPSSELLNARPRCLGQIRRTRSRVRSRGGSSIMSFSQPPAYFLAREKKEGKGVGTPVQE